MAFAALTLGRSPGRALKPSACSSSASAGLACWPPPIPTSPSRATTSIPSTSRMRACSGGRGALQCSVSETGFEERPPRGGTTMSTSSRCTAFSAGSRGHPGRDRGDRAPATAARRSRLRLLQLHAGLGAARADPASHGGGEAPQPGRSERQLALALELGRQAAPGQRGLFRANPAAAQHLDAMLKLDRVYLAHEYLDEHWDLFQFSDVAARLSEAKLSYVCIRDASGESRPVCSAAGPAGARCRNRRPGAEGDDPRLRRQQALPARPVRARQRRAHRRRSIGARCRRSASRSRCRASRVVLKFAGPADGADRPGGPLPADRRYAGAEGRELRRAVGAAGFRAGQGRPCCSIASRSSSIPDRCCR